MNPVFSRPSAALADEAVALAAGIGFTVALIFLMAHFEAPPSAPSASGFTEMKMASLPVEPPPPQPTEYPEPVEAAPVPFIGIDAGPSSSPIKIAAAPPELAAMFERDAPPPAVIEVRQLYSDFRPSVALAPTVERIFQPSEVDQQVRVLTRDYPDVSRVKRDAEIMRATLLLVVDQQGQVGSVRVLKTSGNPEFDEAVKQSVQTSWIFSAAVKAGKPVRCLVQQVVVVKWSSASPFRTQ